MNLSDRRKIAFAPFHINDREFSDFILTQWKEISTHLSHKPTPVAEIKEASVVANTTNLQTPQKTPTTGNILEALPSSTAGYPREVLMQRFHKMVEKRIPIIGGGAGE